MNYIPTVDELRVCGHKDCTDPPGIDHEVDARLLGISVSGSALYKLCIEHSKSFHDLLISKNTRKIREQYSYIDIR